MKIYNTLTGQIEELSSKSVGLYACGPTVYDEPHIGHLRSAYLFDMMRRVLRDILGYKVTYVRNVTDVDDKIIDRARGEGVPAGKIADQYLGRYHDTLRRFGIEAPDHEPKATAHIADMQKIIGALVQKDMAYASSGNVYFRVRKFGPYGDLSHRKNLDELYQNTRKEAGEGKEDPFDFALWKKCDDEPNWDSPWGKGRPGWHIECSAMSSRYLGDEFEIHGGGLDLLFPHHENERAQSMAATGKKFARIWMHHGLVTVNGQKMSKSLKNYVTLDDILKRGYSVEALKMLFLQSHYRNDVDFTWEKMDAAGEILKSFYLLMEKTGVSGSEPLRPDERRAEFGETFHELLGSNFNYPLVLVHMYGVLLTNANTLLSQDRRNEAKTPAKWILKAGTALGLFEKYRTAESKEPWRGALERVLRIRRERRQAKRYDVSDFIRSELVKMGFEAEDGKEETLVLSVRSKLADEELARSLERLLGQAQSMK